MTGTGSLARKFSRRKSQVAGHRVPRPKNGTTHIKPFGTRSTRSKNTIPSQPGALEIPGSQDPNAQNLNDPASTTISPIFAGFGIGESSGATAPSSPSPLASAFTPSPFEPASLPPAIVSPFHAPASPFASTSCPEATALTPAASFPSAVISSPETVRSSPDPKSVPAMSSNLGAAPATTLSPDAVLIPGSGSAPDSAHSLGATSGGGAAPSGAPNGDEQPADNETDVASIWDGSLEEGRRQITTLITKTKRFHGSDQAPSVVAELDRRARSVRAFLFYLEHTATISPTVKEKIHAALNLFKTGDNRTAHVPRGIIDKAVELFDRFEDENWGEDEPDEPEDDTSLAVAATPAAPAAAPARPGIVTNTVETRLPPRNHPIWGINGIMHGVTRYVKKNGGIGYTLDSRYAKRPFDVFGHNGLVPGYWWPTQLVTLFHGAHGHQVRGISGSKDHGAYSIVISGRSIYGDMDEDTGDEVWYSADNSRKNTSRNSLPADSNGSQSLRISLATGSPVRVLRSAGHGAGAAHHWAPSVGYRYDGLYTVVRVRQATNDNGGLYAQFLLRRVQGQPGPGLAVLRQTIPNNQQKADFGRINAGY